jgi:transcriptional regulator of nitric oxide reductase
VVESRNTSKKRKIKSDDIIVLGDVLVVSVHQEPQKTEQRNDRAKKRDNGTKMEQKGTAQRNWKRQVKIGNLYSPACHFEPATAWPPVLTSL